MTTIRTLLAWGLLGLTALPTAGQEDLPLAEAIQRALATHPSIARARSGEAAAEAAVKGARAEFLPTSDLQARATYFDEPMPVNPIHGLDVSDFPNVQGFPDFARDLVQGDVGVRYDLYAGGARRFGLEQAEARREAAASRFASTRHQLLAATVSTYVRILSLDAVLDAQGRRIEALEAEHDRVEQLFAVGRAAEVEVKRIQAARAAAEAERVSLAATLDVAERELARLTGLEPSRTRVARLIPLDPALGPPPPRAVLESQALESSPEVAAAQAQLQASELAVELAGAERKPRVGTRGIFQEFGTFDGLETGEWQVGVDFRLSLFDGGRIAARVGQARAERDQARARLEESRQEVLEALDQALAALERAQARTVSLQEAAEQFREVVRVEALRLEHGAGTQVDYLQAVSELAAAESALAESRFAEIVARTDLARATGTLEPEWIDGRLTASRQESHP